MKGDPLVIGQLQAQLKNELTAINIFYITAVINTGLDKRAKKEFDESIGEMQHAEKLMCRICICDGLPNLQDLGKLMIGKCVPETLECDLRMKPGAQATVKEGIAASGTARD